MSAEMVGVAFPCRESDRAALRAMFQRTLPPVRTGSVVRRCPRCRVELAVGPRLASTGLRVVCPSCAVALGMTVNSFWPRTP